jgi:PAS domain S-box-containing protein
MTWDFAYSPSVWPSLITVFLLTALAKYSLRRRSVPGALPFAISCLFSILIATARLMTYLAVAPETKIFWYRFEVMWWLPAITAITCFVLEYAWPGRWLTRRSLALLSIAPLLFLILNITGYYFSLSPPVFRVGESVSGNFGPAGLFFFVYASLLLVVNLIVFAWLFIHSPRHRWPVTIMAVSQVTARVMVFMETPELNASIYHFPHFALVYTSYAIALFGFSIFDPNYLARQAVIEQLAVGVVVLDRQSRVTSMNPAAEKILQAAAAKVRGQPVSMLLPSYRKKLASDTGTREIEFCQGAGPDTRYYSLTVSRLQDWRGLEAGRLLLLRDVTDQRLAQARLVEQQQALAMLHEREMIARELHDNLGQVFAFVNTQGQAARRMLERGDLSSADAYIGRLVDVAFEADVDIRESITGLRATLSDLGLFPVLSHYLVQYETRYGIHAVLKCPEDNLDNIFEPLVEVHLLRILQEGLTNVRKHSGAQNVQIAFTLNTDCPDAPFARITMLDDGCGFDPEKPLIGKDESLGLRVMRERAKEVGGSIALLSKPGHGTEIVVLMPVKNG